MANTSSQRLIINLGSQSNDGTGDAIRDAFYKVNQNFETIFNVAGLGSGLQFTKLSDAPKTLTGSKAVVTDATGLTLTQVSLVGANGIQVSVDQTQKQLVINATVTNLVNDPHPAIAANLSGATSYRAVNFANPVDDQDLATKKWIYDNFLNRDSNYQYISSTNPTTGANNTTTVVEGSTLRHNIQLVPAGTNTATNVGKTIYTLDALGNTSTLDLSVGAWLPSHITRKDYVDTKLSLQGIDTIDPATGQVNPGFGTMTGPLYLSRDPQETDPGNIAATKNYVDSVGFPSRQNFFVSLTGDDARYNVPAYKRGRSWAWAFRSINRAAQAALQYSKASEIKLGVYQREVTTNNYTELVTISRIDPSSISNDQDHARLNVLYTGGAGGTDPFLERSIRPGMYLQGVDSNAIAEILNVALTQSSNSEEYYEVQYVDYAQTFNSNITPDQLSGTVTFTLFTPNIIEIPEFWIGYVFAIDNGPTGTIQSLGQYYAPNGNVYDTVTVLLDSPLNNLNLISGANWHVYSGFFIKGEALRYGQRYNKLEISIMVESGEFNEQLPIRIGDNISVKGDEFRRTVIKPAYALGTARTSISTSPWANVYFRRDTQVDGIIVVQLDKTTDYAISTAITPNSQSNDSATGVITFTLASGTASASWINKVFWVDDGNETKGRITGVIGNTFSVDIAENKFGTRQLSSGAGVAINSGVWHIYTPVNFGYHYLRDATQPLNYIAGDNPGGFNNAGKLLKANRTFLQSEVLAYIIQQYGGSLVFDHDLCYRDIGFWVDALEYDLVNGNVWGAINAADSYYKANVTKVITTELTATINAISWLNATIQTILSGGTVTRTTGNTATQVKLPKLHVETGAAPIVADLTGAMEAILGGDPTFNPPKYNDQMDIFLMNDATMLRYLGGNGHGGFMKVLDPEGQIKSKSPYTQTCSSFSQSTGKHEFRGGFFVDGFAGNLQVTVDTSQLTAVGGKYYALNDGDATHLVRIPITGLIRKPVFPTFFLDNGISYEVDYIESYNAGAGTGIIHLNPNNPGGVDTVSINSGNTSGEFKPSRSNVPVTFSNPGVAGAITARGYATTDGSGNIASIVVTYPGKGYSAQPSISLGGATFNFSISGGVIVAMTINNGGSGYTTGTTVNIASPGGSGTKATATITSVDGNGSITGINLTYGGTGYSSSTTPTVTFGRQLFTSNIKIGFVGPLPTAIELNAPGNRSMLANDFTQLNDLAYGIFATNGGFIENVSMFSYYCWTSYYALNGAQLRTITGSSAYGMYGLVSEGSNPNEIPTPVTIPDELTQVATVYNQAPYINKAGGSDIYVTLDSTYGYAPYPESEVEVNHYGIRQTYAVTNATQVSGTLYDLSLATTGGGLLMPVPDGATVTIRVKNQWRLYGLNASSITRPSTVLTLSEDPTYNYRVLSYTDKGSDYALTETDQAYDYIQLNPFTINNQYRQGIGRPSISIAGTGFSTSTSYSVTFASPTTKTAVINGNQGTISNPVTQVTIGSASGPIHVGMSITGGGAIANQTVTWVSLDRTTIQTSLAQYWTASNSISFIGTTATALAYASNAGGISRVSITDPGVGYDTAPVGTVTGGTSNAVINTSLSGNSGTSVIKVLPLSGTAASRISAGISSATPYYYVLGYEGVRYQINNYFPPSTTGQAWGEIEVTGYYNSSGAISSLTREMMVDPLYAGVSKNTPGAVTILISTLRATAHDMVDVGTGGYATSKIPNDLYGPPTLPKNQAHETKELNKGRVYYVTTDQDGNFRVGKYFSVDQGRGTVSITAPISLTGINKLSFKKGVTVDEFSIDDTMAANSSSKVPVESAVIGYLAHILGADRTGAKATGQIGPGYMALNGVNAMTGNMSLGANKIVNLAVPTSSSDGATKGYADTKLSILGMNEATNNGGQAAGLMTGPLRLVSDPATTTATVVSTVNISSTVISVNSTNGLYLGMQVNNSSAAGSTITNIDSVANAVTISPATVGAISSGTIVTFDPVQQGATKRYVDKVQFSTLRDVSLTGVADTDLAMFGTTLTASSGTSVPLYSTTRQVINVANNTAAISNTPTSSSGGSDITLTRSGNSITFKLVGGQGNANPITNYHINNSAAIAQSKLNMQAATTSISAPGSFTQSALGLAVFNNSVFSATNGWIDLADSSSVSTGIAPSKMQWVPTGGGLLGATNLSANTAATYLSSSTVRTWLGVIDSASGGTFNGNLNVNNIYPNANNTYNIGTNANRFAAIYGTALYDSGNRVVTSVTASAGSGISITSSVTGGQAASFTVNNTGILSVVAGNSISITTGQNPTIDTVQDIRTSASPTFNGLTLSSLSAASGGATVNGAWTLGAGASFQATYADLAEWYSADSKYEPGTVLIFGGDAEVTTTTISSDSRVAGVVTTDPAYTMNSGLEGTRACIALVGRIPVKVIGTVRKGDMLTTSNTPGYAQKAMNPTVGTIIGKALATKDTPDAGWVEVAVGRM